ncbi:Protein tyrosine phosphatase type IVA 1 like protein [Argiope bruennichi]|uniref:Protein tyrosine phosphatase type IVA 1 like protein n=1 Tax=Argiope bruennichi TaxID=94029 RepID=A0A8T0EA55_ARGBR|nr:Protein tyrosine phosphatase type IVA 1 like protein [Argiope bruennichi]
MTMKQKLMRPGPSEIVFKNMRFLIMDRPTDATINTFIEELKKKNVTEVVRVCEPTYKTDVLEKHGIKVLYLVLNLFSKMACIAPVLVAIALMELGMKYEDAVELIRQKRRGAINAKQLAYLQKYRPKSRLKTQNGLKQCCIQ